MASASAMTIRIARMISMPVLSVFMAFPRVF
jgi:uncharacterized protein YndB with AHSA1/START domain